MLFVLATRLRGEEKVGALIYAVVLLVLGLPCLAACVLPFFPPRRPWVRGYDLVIIRLGRTGCCILSVSVALLIDWITLEVKLWFNRT